jgi:isopentenyldiphosphate isomerase
MDELLDIVNTYDEVIGQKYRSEIYAQALDCFRVINGFIINDQNMLWIPVRTRHKALFPLSVDASVGGHVSAGETYQQAFVRELREELNLDADSVPHTMIAKLTPQEHNVSAFTQLYIIKTNLPPIYNREDFCDAFWIDAATLQKKISDGLRAKHDLPILLSILSSYI